jgi:hypothetical protein
MEWVAGVLFIILLGVAMLASICIAVVFCAGLDEPKSKDVMGRKKKRPF